MHLAILMANTDESAFADQHPKDGEKWRALLAPLCPECRFSIYSVKDGEFPEQPLGDFDGMIVTGSPASVLDGSPWQDRLCEVIRQAEAQRVPLFGACFGHQAIALALGGQVGKNADDWVFGVTETKVHSPAPWMDASKGPLLLNAAHEEQVSHAPANARIIMGNDDCQIGGFTLGNHVFTTQYHPEITPHFMAALIDELEAVKPAAVIKQARESLSKTPQNAVFARWIMQFFQNAS